MDESKKAHNLDTQKKKIKLKGIDYDLVSISIFITITAFYIFLESIYTLIKGVRTGFLRKEILSEDSNLGFDIYIKMKS